MLIGAHVSAASGLFNAPLNAKKLGLECFQFFSRPPQGGAVSDISQEHASLFLTTCEKNAFVDYYIHAPYIVNLASKEARIRNNSIHILRGELERGSLLKARAMMAHLGSASGVGDEVGIKLVIEGLKKILDGHKGSTQFLIEISAGAGAVVGDTFEEIAAILDGVGDDTIGICFDTAHAFASGYDLRDKKSVAATMKKFDGLIGLDRLLISHCNDSKVEFGAKKDRHEHLGHGYIGRAGFEAIVNSPVFKKINLILETEPDEIATDITLLKKLRGSRV